MGDRETVTKPLALPALLMLEEAEIKAVFPFGAVCNRNGKWKPCKEKEKPAKTLDRLIKEKRKRVEKPIYLRQSYSIPKGFPDHPDAPSEPGGNYTTNPRQAVGVNKHGRGAPEEAALDPVTQARFSQEARLRHAASRTDDLTEWQAKVIANKIAKVQREAVRFGLDLGPAFNQLIREAQAEIAKSRKAAA